MSKRTLKAAALALSASAVFTASAHADYVDAILPSGQHVPCGLYVPAQAGSPGQVLTYTWTIGNCHVGGVWRREVYFNGARGTCRWYDGHRGYQYSTRGTYPKTIEAC